MLTALYLYGVWYLTLRARPYGDDIAGIVDRVVAWLARREATAWITFDVVEFGANVAMFLPLGVFVVLWFGVRRWWLAPATGLLLSGAIEGIQYVFLDSRVADVRDLVANTAGALVGGLLMVLLAFLLTPSGRHR